MSQNLNNAIFAVKEAGKIIKKNYGQKNDFVTNIDIQVEEKIINMLKNTGYSFLGEETGESIQNNSKKWVIDPIDGTSNFIHNIPFFAISVALVENNHDLLLGVVYNPITEECYYAEKGFGAFLNGKSIHTGKTNLLNESLILMEHGRSKECHKQYVACLSKLMLQEGATILRQGATALMLCLVARGDFDAFLSVGDELYDHAAIAQEAGCNISDWNGRAWTNSNPTILATNPLLKIQIIKKINKIW